MIGGYSVLLQAAGIETYAERRSKKGISRESLFGAEIEQAVSEHTPRPFNTSRQNFKPMLLIGDTHFPFAHHPTLEWAYRVAEKEQPEYIVQMGDLQDQFSHSRFPSSRNYYKPDEEMELGRKQAVAFWDELKRACPRAQCYQITGNHDLRALRSVLQSAPSLEGLVRDSLTKLYQFQGVTTIHDYREELIIQNILIHHGYMGKLGMQRDFVMQDTATAHTHKGGVLFRALKNRIIAHLDCGFTGDPESKAFTYTPQKITGYTLGLGWWDEYGPRFIPK
jgi:predicted MPP superfamily phosphohydrolase